MGLYEKILVAVDFSEHSSEALRRGAFYGTQK